MFKTELAADSFPAASIALTVKEYAVDALNPVTLYVLLGEDPILVVPL